MAEIRGISVTTMSQLRSTVRRLRSLESVVELPVGLDDLSALAENLWQRLGRPNRRVRRSAGRP